MANVYVEGRPKGRCAGAHIDDYVVEDQSNQILGKFQTQTAAINWAKAHGHQPVIVRVPHLNDRKNPDHWRAV